MKKLFFLLLPAVLLTACGGSDDNEDGTQKDKVVNVNANDATVHPEYARLEFPHLKGGANNRVLIHSTTDYGVNYCVEWDDTKKSQRWSCYQMYKRNLEQNTTRYRSESNQYPHDDLIPAQYRFSTDPYWNSGYQHGHICPSADRLCSYQANYQTFFLSNMQPQVGGFNSGVWLNMENKVRDWAKGNNYTFCDTLYVCKGGTIDNTDQIITTTSRGLIVPRYFFMAVMRVKNGQYNAIGFWVEHASNDDSQLSNYAVSIDELERLTGIDFFCNLPDDREATIEASTNLALWGLN